MENRWSEKEASKAIERYGEKWGDEVALRVYSSRLLGCDAELVLHGGGNTSVKTSSRDVLGEELETIFVKASGWDLATVEPEGFAPLELDSLRRLRPVEDLPDGPMIREVRRRLLDPSAPNPSIETLVHAFIPGRFVDHTHADAVLTLSNQQQGRELIEELFGDEALILDYVTPGFELAKATAEALEESPEKKAMIWLKHGIVTWGDSARESYDRMIELVSKAERFLAERADAATEATGADGLEAAREKWIRLAPLLRGLLAVDSGDEDRPRVPVILTPLVEPEILGFLGSQGAREALLTPPLTSDHLIRTKVLPLWVEELPFADETLLEERLRQAVNEYKEQYRSYVKRNGGDAAESAAVLDPAPRVVLAPGVGAFCSGRNIEEAKICRDVTRQTIRAKSRIAVMGVYEGMEEAHLYEMEHRGLQQAKLAREASPLTRMVAVVTGAAGAIGVGICRGLLGAGCHVAVTDLPGEHLDSLVRELASEFGDRVTGVPIDVTDSASVESGFNRVIAVWGGVDVVIVNAGIALVSSLSEMDIEAFRRLERVNVEGTLLLLAEAGRHFEKQGIGGDIVLVSTKNVFAPGARFGAYSATKAGAHQLARIASLELASLGVRVNMVAPDAIFGEGVRKSGLWAEVGPDRMKARGLTEESLQEYYRSRNLLKSRITARHVSNAVLFFVKRETPTTGATIPVDGGLPDATPR